jgi:hypothetical protein
LSVESKSYTVSTYIIEVVEIGLFNFKVGLGRVDCDLGSTCKKLSSNDLDERNGDRSKSLLDDILSGS